MDKKIKSVLITVLVIVGSIIWSVVSKNFNIVDLVNANASADIEQQVGDTKSKRKLVKTTETTEYKPKGQHEQFCEFNVFNGRFPLVSKGFGDNLVKLCYHGFGVLYSPDYKIPLFATEKLTPQREQKAKNGEREQTFYPDPNLIEKFGEQNVVKTEDYIGAKSINGNEVIRYDRGHLAPSRDMMLEDRYESFYLSNIVPQSSYNNRNIWANIEKSTRCLAIKYNTEVYVVTIPVLDVASGKIEMLNKKNIAIPKYMAKAIYVPKIGLASAYITLNNNDKDSYSIISIAELEKISFIKPFPEMSATLKSKIMKLPKPNQCD